MLNFIHQVRERYDLNASKNVTKYINKAKQIEKNKLGIEFIKKCLNHEKLPNFSRINLHNNDLSQNNKFLLNIRREITNEVLNNKIKAKNSQLKELQKLQNALFDIQPNDWIKLKQLVDEKKAKIKVDIDHIHQKKLTALGIEEIFNVNCNNINKKRNNIDKTESILNSKSIFNFSKRKLTEIETSVLNKGLKFGIKNRKIDSYELISHFEELAQSLDWIEINPTQQRSTQS